MQNCDLRAKQNMSEDQLLPEAEVSAKSAAQNHSALDQQRNGGGVLVISAPGKTTKTINISNINIDK
jgi:hypothetical protein